MKEDAKYKLILLLCFVGFIIAGVFGLSEHLTWLGSMCGGLSGACRETAQVLMLHLPIWVWGVAFFFILAFMAAVRRTRAAVMWVVAAAVGFEFVLVLTMVVMRWFCIFCIANLVVVFLLAVAAFDGRRLWQALAICLLAVSVTGFVLPHENGLISLAGAGKPQPDIAATVAGQEITEAQVIGPNANKIMELEQEVFRIKQQRMEELIAEVLLQKEAAARGITVQQLINDEVISKGVTVTDEEINKYYQENSSRLAEWKGSQEELRNRVKAALQQEKSYRKTLEYTNATLAPKYGVQVFLKEPQPILVKVNIDESPSLGPQDAPVTVIEFSDYECPSCRQAHETVKKVREEYKRQLRWVFKDFPLKRHQYAELAAQAAWCAKEQDKFWQFQDLLYTSTEPLTSEQLKRLALQMGMNPESFAQCLDSGKYKSTVEKEIDDSRKAGVDRTPTFIINGRLMTGAMPLEQFRQVINEELLKAKAKQ